MAAASPGKQAVAPCSTKTMTISFILAATKQVESEYPTYLLESKDGQYQLKLSAASDLVKNGDYFQLRFEKLKPGQSFKLTRYGGSQVEEVIFKDKSTEIIEDQDRSSHKVLENHDYTEFQFDFGTTIPAVSPDNPDI
jgi:hypothetical protein